MPPLDDLIRFNFNVFRPIDFSGCVEDVRVFDFSGFPAPVEVNEAEQGGGAETKTGWQRNHPSFVNITHTLTYEQTLGVIGQESTYCPTTHTVCGFLNSKPCYTLKCTRTACSGRRLSTLKPRTPDI
jgi:hypothetical protein